MNSPADLSFREALRFAWSSYRRHASVPVAVLLTMLGAWVALEVMVVAGRDLGLAWWAAAHLAFFLVFAALEAGFVQVCVTIRAGGRPAFAAAAGQWRVAPAFLLGQLVYLALVVGGLALLILPGLVFAGRYAFFGFSLISGEANIPNSFRRSAAVSAGVGARLAGLLALLLLFNTLGAAVLGVGLLVTVPVSVLTLADVYTQLRRGLAPPSS